MAEQALVGGHSDARHGVSLVVHEGELVTLLGSNGAGKTTMMRAISGLRPLTSGSVLFEGADISRVKAHRRVTDGLIQSPEGRGVFPGMTVTENLWKWVVTEESSHPRPSTVNGWTGCSIPSRGSPSGDPRSAARCPAASSRCWRSAIAMARPRLLLLDEPWMGLAPMIISQIFRIISDINAHGTTVLLVEQNAQQALSRSDRAYILETGAITRTGVARELLAAAGIRAAYLGVA